MLLAVKNPPAPKGDMSHGFYLWVAKIPWKRKWQPTSLFLPGEFHGQRDSVTTMLVQMPGILSNGILKNYCFTKASNTI